MSNEIFALRQANEHLKQQLDEKDLYIQRLHQQLQQQGEEIARLKKNAIISQAHMKPPHARASLAMKSEESSKAMSSSVPAASSPSMEPFSFQNDVPDATNRGSSSSISFSCSDASRTPTMSTNMSLKNQQSFYHQNAHVPVQNFQQPTPHSQYIIVSQDSDQLVMGALPAAPKSSKHFKQQNINAMSAAQAYQPSQPNQPWRQQLRRDGDDADQNNDENPPPPPDVDEDESELADFIPPPPDFELTPGLATIDFAQLGGGLSFSNSPSNPFYQSPSSHSTTFGAYTAPSDTTVVHPVQDPHQNSIFVEQLKVGSQNAVIMKARVQPSSSTVFPCWEPPATGQQKVFVPSQNSAPDCFIVRVHEGQSELDLLDEQKKKNLHNVALANQPVLLPGYDFNPKNFAPQHSHRDSRSDLLYAEGDGNKLALPQPQWAPGPVQHSLALQLKKQGSEPGLFAPYSPFIHGLNLATQHGGSQPELFNSNSLPSNSPQLGQNFSSPLVSNPNSRHRNRSGIHHALPTMDNQETIIDVNGQKVATISSPTAAGHTFADRHASSQIVAAGNNGINHGNNNHTMNAPPGSSSSNDLNDTQSTQQQMQQIRHMRRTSGHYTFGLTGEDSQHQQQQQQASSVLSLGDNTSNAAAGNSSQNIPHHPHNPHHLQTGAQHGYNLPSTLSSTQNHQSGSNINNYQGRTLYNPQIAINIPTPTNLPPPSDSIPLPYTPSTNQIITTQQPGSGVSELSNSSLSINSFTSIPPQPTGSGSTLPPQSLNQSALAPKVISTNFDPSALMARNDRNQINGKPKYPSLGPRSGSSVSISRPQSPSESRPHNSTYDFIPPPNPPTIPPQSQSFHIPNANTTTFPGLDRGRKRSDE